MKRYLLGFALFGLALAYGGTPAALTQEKKTEAQTIDLKQEAAGKPAAAVNFSKELELPFPSLFTLGGRIDAARREADPVGLAAAALELGAVETVAAKKASLTADAVLQEALKLAKLRAQSRELKAVALLSGSGKAKEELEALAVKVAKAESDHEAAVKAGERTRGLQGTLTIRSQVNQTVDIYLNGYSQGVIYPFQTKYISVWHAYNTNTAFEFYGREGGRWHWYITGAVPKSEVCLRP